MDNSNEGCPITPPGFAEKCSFPDERCGWFLYLDFKAITTGESDPTLISETMQRLRACNTSGCLIANTAETAIGARIRYYQKLLDKILG